MAQCRVAFRVGKVDEHLCLRALKQRLHAPRPPVDARADQRRHPLLSPYVTGSDACTYPYATGPVTVSEGACNCM